jgi:hypothetical protein
VLGVDRVVLQTNDQRGAGAAGDGPGEGEDGLAVGVLADVSLDGPARAALAAQQRADRKARLLEVGGGAGQLDGMGFSLLVEQFHL